MMIRPTTPKRISGRIRQFLRELDAEGPPSFLPFTFIAENYKAGYCLDNCEAEMKRSGCRIVFGWMIWECSRLVDAEFHAVVEAEGKLIDLTPRVDGEPEVLFVPDLKRAARRADPSSWHTWENALHPKGEWFKPPQEYLRPNCTGVVMPA